MPNWCKTEYKVIGKAEIVERLGKVMQELGNKPDPGLVNNSYGSTWLGNLVAHEGGDPDSIECRGDWSLDSPDSPVVDGVLSFSVLSAWSEMDEWRHFIEDHFGVEVIFLAEEFGSGVYETNDTDHRFFPESYYFRVDSEESPEYEYHDSLESLIQNVEEVTGVSGLSSYEECEKALSDHQAKDGSFEYFLIRLSYVN